MATTSYSSTFTTLLVIFTLLITTQTISSSPIDATANGSYQLGTTTQVCDGSIGVCFGENEFDMDSESNRRILATSDYISYEALKRNSVPCSRRGSSYYNCQAGSQANPYNRGCSAITRCRG